MEGIRMFDYEDFLKWKHNTVQEINLVMDEDERVNPQWEYWILIYYFDKVIDAINHKGQG